MLAEEKGKGMQIDELLFKIKNQQTDLESIQIKLSEKEAALMQALSERDALTLTLADTVALLDSTRVALATSQEQLLASQKLLIQFQQKLYAREIELENSNAMVDAQRATEYRLTSQALEVLSALDTTLNAKSALHEKVERKGAVEKHNAAATATFHSRVGEDITQMQATEKSLQQDAKTQVAAIQANIDAIAQTRSTQASELSASQTSFDSSMVDQSAALTDAVAQFQTTHTATIISNGSTIESYHQARAAQFASVQQQGDEYFTSISKDAAAIQGLTAAFYEQSVKNATEVSQASISYVQTDVIPKLNAIESTASTHSAEAIQAQNACSLVITAFQEVQTARVASDAKTLQERIAAMQAANAQRVQEMAAANTARVQALTQANTERIAKMQAEQAALVAKLQSEMVDASTRMQEELMNATSVMQNTLVTSVSEMQTAFIAEVDAMISAHKTEQIATLAASVQDVTSRVASITAAESKAISALQVSIAGVNSNAAMYQIAVQNRLAADAKIAGENEAVIVNKQEAFSAQVDASKQSVHTSIDACIAVNESRRIDASKEIAALTAATAAFATAQNASIAQAAQTCEAQGASVVAWIVSVSDADSKATNQLHDSISAIASRIESHGTATDATIDATLSHIDSYISRDLTRDVPLGTTPQKSAAAPVYPVHSQLAKTASPSSVISTYRQTHPAKPLVFQGVLKMEGIEELPVALDDIVLEAPSTGAAAAAIAAAAPAPAAVPTVTMTLPAHPPVHRSSGALSAAVAVPLPAASDDEEEDAENMKPPTPVAEGNVEKAGKKLSGPSGKLAAVAAAAIAGNGSAAGKPVSTRSSSRLRYGTLPTVHTAGEAKQ
jgi:hypothetical protein